LLITLSRRHMVTEESHIIEDFDRKELLRE